MSAAMVLSIRRSSLRSSSIIVILEQAPTVLNASPPTGSVLPSRLMPACTMRGPDIRTLVGRPLFTKLRPIQNTRYGSQRT